MNVKEDKPLVQKQQKRRWLWCGMAVAGPVAISWLLQALTRFGRPTEQAYFYLLLILLVSYRGGRGSGILASVLSALALYLLALSATGMHTLGAPAATSSLSANSADLAVFLVVSIVMSHVSAREANERWRAARHAAELDTILEHLTDAVLFVDNKGVIVKTNPAAIHVLGISQPRDALLPLSSFSSRFGLQPQGHEPIEFTATTPFHEVPCIMTQPGRSPVYLTLDGTPLFDPDGHPDGMALVIHDSTVLKEAQAQRDDFVAMTSHELKTPVTSIKGYAQLATRMLRKGDPAAVEPSLQRLQESAERLSTLVDRLVEYARVSQSSPVLERYELDLLSLVRDLVESTASVAASHHLVVEPDDQKALPCHCDGDRLQRALGHLLGNAVRYSAPGSTITCSLTRQEGAALLTIRDQGIGVPAAEQERVFQPFVRGSNADSSHAGGLGVGLYISKRIVEGHGGSIRLHSEEGNGTTVYVTLPLQEQIAA